LLNFCEIQSALSRRVNYSRMDCSFVDG